MSETLALKTLAALERAGIGGAGIAELANEHLPAVDEATGLRPPVKETKAASSTASKSSSSRSRSRSSSSKSKTPTASSGSGSGASE